ncbi:ferritin-like domain-containing protein [Halorussus sp. AFM4]|uniref:YciE/YciF ferroxidase family protein n=1 Tax=Halorussus sp. AFM4 TaxID=3421651 RepID=UPI003EBE984A
MALDTAEDLFEYELRGAYYAERQLVDLLDELQTSATEADLVDGFADHRDETDEHVERLERVFALLDLDPVERTVPTVDALREEKREADAESNDEAVQNALYNHVGRKAEQIELTAYEGLLALADVLDVDDEAVDLLEQNRDEDRAALDELESVSEGGEFESFVDRLL